MATNGHVVSDKADIPATSLLAEFVATTTKSHLTSTLREKVKEVVVDYLGVTIGALDNADSTGPIYDAILNLQGGNTKGPRACTVLGKGEPHFLPQYAGLLNATFSHSLDFDDTYIDGTLHAGCTAVSAALTQAELLRSGTSTEDFMLAVALGYEITCRVGRELGFEAYHRGFHNTGTAGIFGAVAAIASLKRLPSKIIEMAFGLAGSKAAGSMQYLENGSWNKRLHPGFAVHDAFMCIVLAESNVIGATKSIEGKNGFLKAYSPNEKMDIQRLVAGLGHEWVWLSSSLKPYAACRMTHALIELAGNIHTAFAKDNARALVADDIQKITVWIPVSNFILVGDPTPNKIHPQNVIDGQFSAYFQAANALLFGSNTGLKAYQRLTDSSIHDLCSKITVIPDENAVRGFPGRLRILWKDGTEEEKYQEFALGEVQHPYTRDRVEEKFFSLAAPAFGESRAKQILQTVDNLESKTIEGLLQLLR